MSKRKATEKLILEYIDKIAPGGENKKLYQDLFKRMNDKEFDEFMLKLKNKKITLSVVSPNTGKNNLDVERNFKIGKELGYNFFQKLIVTGDRNLPDYKTPIEFCVLSLPARRAAQLLTKKISIPIDDKSIDLTTGQVTGKSKGSKLTMPEIQVLAGMGFTKSLDELMKIRGGDLGAKNALSTLLMRQGIASQEVVNQYATGVVSTKTFSTYLKAQHIKNNL